MLYARVNLTVREDRTYSDRKIMLYRGDNNVDIEFNLTSYDYIIEDSKYVQAILTRPYAPSIFSDLFELNENKFTLTITGDMIDELTELEMYTMQLILFDEAQEDKVTLPPCYDIFDIKKPLATEAARINWAAVNYDTVAIDEEYTDDTIFEGNEYIQTNWRDGDIISDTRLNKIETALSVVAHKAGSGAGGTTSTKLSTTDPEVLVLNAGSELELNISFFAESTGRGILYVTVGNIDKYSTSIPQGNSRVSIPENIFTKGVNVMSIYAMDRNGNVSNKILFEVRYGSLELKSTFDYDVAYDYQSAIRFYYTPSVADTSLELTFHMLIDEVERASTTCTSDVRNYFEFPTDLSAGKHFCEAFVSDPNGTTSNVIKFYLVLLTNDNLVITSNTRDVVVEEGSQLVLDYKVYMKNEISFVNKIYVDNNLVNTGTCGLERNYYKTSSLTEGEHSVIIEVSNQAGTKSDSITFGVTVTPSTYSMITETNAGLLFSGTAFNKTNSDQNKEVWVGKDQYGNTIQGSLVNFAFNNESGWVNDSLIISGNSHVEIPIKPLSTNATTGFTLDIEFLSKQIGVDNAEVLNIWDDAKNCGVKITTENIILRSASGHECNLYFTDDEFTNVIFVVDRNELTAKIYLNGVMCSAFHLSDYVANGVSYLEDFTVDKNIIIGGKSKNGYCKIKNLRVYEVALTTDEILNNFMSNERDKSKQQTLFEFQKGNTLPTLTIYCDFSGLGKDDKKPCKIIYNSTDEVKYGKSFVLDHKQSSLQYQGTSSMAYPIKNYRLNLRDEEGNKLYYAFPNGKPECRFTLKADFMSSGHWQNTGFTKWVNDNLYNYDTSNQKSMNPKKWFDVKNGGSIKDTRECIYGFPCRLILVNDGTSPLNEGQNEPTPGNTKDMGIFNFNNDKDCADTIGFDQVNFPNCASFEIAANSDTSAGAFMSYSSVNPEGLTELEYLKQSFELRFPKEDTVTDEWGFMGIGEEGTGIKALIDWVDKSSDEEFVRDFEQHFHKDYTLRYYLIVMVCGMVDNLGKNMMLDTWDNKIWMPRFYDCDTICSYDNSGDIKFDVDIEMEQGYWNTSSSRLWTRIRDLMHDELVSKYNDMRKNGLSYESLMRCFYDEQIAKIPQKYYNMDFDVKYAPFGDSYMGMAHGDGYQHLKRWLKKRLIFCDTLFDYAPSYNNDVLTIRANTTNEMILNIETYTPLYQHLSWYNGQMDKKKIDGKTSVSFSGTAMAATDQEVLIYGGSNIKRITGIKSMNPNQMLIGYATKLASLNASDCPLLDNINSNGANLSPHIYLSDLDLSNCTQLTGALRIDNSQLIRSIDVSGTGITSLQLPTSLRNLESLTLTNTIEEITLRDAPLLTEFTIPTNIRYLHMDNVPSLTEFSGSGTYNNLETLILDGLTIDPIEKIVANAKNIKNIRLTNLNVKCIATNVLKLLNLNGVDIFGNTITLSEAITGKIKLAQCSVEIERQLKVALPNVTFEIIGGYLSSFTVTFVDGDGNTIYTTTAVENGEAVYVGPTPTKTSTVQYNYEFSGWDQSLKPILGDTTITARFNSILRYYTVTFYDGIAHDIIKTVSIAYGNTAKSSAPNLPSTCNTWVPALSTTITGDTVFTSKYEPYPEDISIFKLYTANSSKQTCTIRLNPSVDAYPSRIIFPFKFTYNSTTYDVDSIYGTSANATLKEAITDVYIPQSIANINAHSFYYFGVSKLELPPSVTFLDSSQQYKFSSMSNLTYFYAPGVTKTYIPNTTGQRLFYECPKLETLIFGSKERPFTRWYDSSSNSYCHIDYASYNNNILKAIYLVTSDGTKNTVTIPDSLPYSDKFICVKDKPYEITKDDMVFMTDGYDYCELISYNGTESEIVIPETVNGINVTRIGNKAFKSNTTITSITGNNIKNIGNYAFQACTSLVSVSFPSATSIGKYGFNNCTVLTSIDFPLVTEIGTQAFRSCSKLTSASLPLITEISLECFYGCLKLNSVNCPKATIIWNSAFYNCKDLPSIDFPLVTDVAHYAFYGCESVTSVSLPKVTTIGESCFAVCNAMESIDLPLLESIGIQAFTSCSKLKTVNFPKVTAIPSNCFYNCSLIESVSIPKVISVGSYAFHRCSALNTINLPLTTSIGSYSFASCGNLVSISIPLVTIIGNNGFAYTSKLPSIELPSIKTIDNNCFYASNSLTSITLGGPGKPITNTSGFNSYIVAANGGVTKTLNIYVEDPSNPPTLTGSPWGASSATINYLQA